MATYIYRRKPSTGAQDLAEALDGIRFRARTRPIERAAKRGDVVVAWGEGGFAVSPGVRVLNGGPVRNKFQDALTLRAAGVSTITVALVPEQPAAQVAPVDPAIGAFTRAQEFAQALADLQVENLRLRLNPILNQGITELSGALTDFSRCIAVPAPVAAPVVTRNWIPRNNDHVGGNDLLTPTTTPDYYVVKENIVKEFRIHSFLGKSIRAGVKALRDGYAIATTEATYRQQAASEWIRSWDGGWRIKYDGVSSKKKHRELAHAAVKALGLDFGAVDIGERADGTLIVLEVNRAPGLSEGTIDRYATAIQSWINGEPATIGEVDE